MKPYQRYSRRAFAFLLFVSGDWGDVDTAGLRWTPAFGQEAELVSIHCEDDTDGKHDDPADPAP